MGAAAHGGSGGRVGRVGRLINQLNSIIFDSLAWHGGISHQHPTDASIALDLDLDLKVMERGYALAAVGVACDNNEN